MINFIHTGDIHLGLQFNNVSFDRDKALNRRRELWSTFERIVNKSLDEQVDFLLIAGDLFEANYFTLGDIKRVRDLFKEAKDVNIIISAGNHDFRDEKSLYNRVEWSSNVFIFSSDGIEKKEFKELNTVIYGYSWDRIEIREHSLLKDLSIDRDKYNILLIHGDVNNSNYLPLDLNQLKALNMDYIALGHIHKPHIFSDKMAYCGSPEPLDFGEIGDRGFIQGRIDESGTKIEFVPFSKRRFLYKDIEINENMGYLEIVREIKNIDLGTKKEDFYRVNLNGYIQNDISLDDLHGDLDDEFYHLELIDNLIPDYDLEALEAANRNNIIGQFIKAMKLKGLDNPLVKDSLYYGLGALLKGRVL